MPRPQEFVTGRQWILHWSLQCIHREPLLRKSRSEGQMLTNSPSLQQDTTYKSPSCSSRCTDDKYGDVVYKSSDNLWACCGTYESCDNPTNETFLALAPQQLLAAASSQSASSATASSSSQPQTTATSNSASKATVTVTNTPSIAAGYQETSSSLSGGAKAGIGVGAAVAAVVIIALLVWVILLRKGMRSNDQNRYLTGRRDGGVLNEGSSNEAREIAVREQELGGYELPHEMEGIP